MTTKEPKSTEKANQAVEEKLGAGAYVALILILVFFSGLLGQWKGWWSFFDFGTLAGKFGSIGAGADAHGAITFEGKGGDGARGGFLFALGLVPAVMFAIGSVTVAERFGALKAAQKLLTVLLRPVLGLPGRTGLAMISSLQSTDAGASMTRLLKEDGQLTERQNSIFSMFQLSSGATITNFLGTGAALWAMSGPKGRIDVPTSIALVFAVQLVLKFFGANLMRLYLMLVDRKKTKSLLDGPQSKTDVSDRQEDAASPAEASAEPTTEAVSADATHAAPVAAVVEEKQSMNPITVFVEGAYRGFGIGVRSVLPNVLMAFVIIKVLKVTGIMDIFGTALAPVMGIFGLPGEAAAVLLASFLSMGGGVGAVGGLLGHLNGTNIAILAPAMFLMGSLVQYWGRILGVTKAKHSGVMMLICVINALIAMAFMNLIV